MADPVPATPQEIAAVKSIIDSMGLNTLWNGVNDLLTRGYTDADQILFMLSNDSTPEGKVYQEAYFKRFPAVKMQREENQRRLNTGLPPIPELTAAQYVAQEQAYQQATQKLPGNLATSENITKWIAGNVSPSEVQGRIQVAEDYILNQVNPGVRNELRDVYGLTDQQMVQYVLSDQKTQSQLETEWQANIRRANVGAAAKAMGFNVNNDLRDEIAMADQGYSYGATTGQFANIAAQSEDYARLGAISGVQTTAQDLVREEFNLKGGESTTKLKRRLASQERGRFSTSSAIGRDSLSRGGIGTQ